MNAGFFPSLEHVSSVRAPMLYEATDKPRVEAGAEPCRPAHGAAVAIVQGLGTFASGKNVGRTWDQNWDNGSASTRRRAKTLVPRSPSLTSRGCDAMSYCS